MSKYNTNLHQQTIQESKYLKDVLNEQLASLQEMNQKLVNSSIQLQIKTDQVQRAEEQMSQLAHHDFLTQLPNRMQFDSQLEREIALAKRHGTTLAILFIDLDKFKDVNDSLGHGIGDLLLQSVANNLRAAVRDTDTVSRQGGDEFMMLLPNVKNEADIAHKVRKIHQIISTPHHVADHTLHVGASIGISIFPDDGTDSETLVLRADAAMYAAKKSGRDQYQFFRQAMNDRTVEQQTLETGLHSAIERSEMELYYQAQITLETGTICGAEALLRWHHPTRGLLLPGIFVPVAEGCGAIIPIGRWVLREACRQAQCWLEAGLLRGTISVNISILEFICEDFLDDVRSVLRDTGLPARYLDLEVTETALVKNLESTVPKLQALRSMGLKISIDDFGTGDLSLSALRHFPVDCLKIAPSFVSDICHNNEGSCLVSPIIGIGKCLKQHVIAEGIETREQLDYLRQNECATGQGYYLHEPASAANFGEFLQAKSLVGLPARVSINT